MDLLPERSADMVAQWLAQHPTVTVVCRDRSALYADGIRRGAPHAVQVVDRFHLVKNLREAIEAFLHDQRPALQAAAACTAQVLTQVAGPVAAPTMYRGRHRCAQAGQRRQEAAQQHRHAAWVTTYEAIHTLRAQGTSVTAIAAQLGISRPTVYAYLRRTRPPSPRSPQRSGQVLRPYMAYLVQRWRQGCTDSMQLWREMRALGYAYSARTVSRFITRLRRASAAGWAPETLTSPYTRPQGPSARAVSFAWVCPDAKRSQDAQLYVDQLRQGDQSIGQAYTLSQAFLALVRGRRGDALETWMTEAVASGIETLARFAQGLQEISRPSKRASLCPGATAPSKGISIVSSCSNAKAMGVPALRSCGSASSCQPLEAHVHRHLRPPPQRVCPSTWSRGLRSEQHRWQPSGSMSTPPPLMACHARMAWLSSAGYGGQRPTS